MSYRIRKCLFACFGLLAMLGAAGPAAAIEQLVVQQFFGFSWSPGSSLTLDEGGVHGILPGAGPFDLYYDNDTFFVKAVDSYTPGLPTGLALFRPGYDPTFIDGHPPYIAFVPMTSFPRNPGDIYSVHIPTSVPELDSATALALGLLGLGLARIGMRNRAAAAGIQTA